MAQKIHLGLHAYLLMRHFSDAVVSDQRGSLDKGERARRILRHPRRSARARIIEPTGRKGLEPLPA